MLEVFALLVLVFLAVISNHQPHPFDESAQRRRLSHPSTALQHNQQQAVSTRSSQSKAPFSAIASGLNRLTPGKRLETQKRRASKPSSDSLCSRNASVAFPFGCRPPCEWNNLIFMYRPGTKCCQSNCQHSSPRTKTNGSIGHITGPQEIAFEGSNALRVWDKAMGGESS